MAERGSYGLSPRLDIQQLSVEAQHRWLRPAEICEILRNYQKFRITSEPPTRPPSGSLFLFDRKVLRYFRKDGHNWRKKKDGKTVKEAHEKLKVGSIDVLHCYYAHGEDNENFQRRSYWMLEQELMHIVFVHYLEVKGNRTNIGGVRETDEFSQDLSKASPQISSSSANNCKEPSGNTDYTSPSSSLTSLYEDADTGDSHQASSTYHSYSGSPQPQVGNGLLMNNIDVSFLTGPAAKNHEGHSSINGADYMPHLEKDRPMYNDSPGYIVGQQKTLGLGSWEEILEQCTMGFHTDPACTGVALEQQNMTLNGLSACDSTAEKELDSSLPTHSSWQIPFEDNSLLLPKLSVDQPPNSELPCYQDDLFNTLLHQQKEKPAQSNLQAQLPNAESECLIASNADDDIYADGNMNYSLSLRRQLFDGEEGLKKVDSFSRWVSKELGEVDNLQMQSSSGISWSTVECGNVVDDSSLSPSLSQDQLFSIIDVSPKWGYADLETEVLTTGTFLKSQQEVAKYNWSCMFGEVEVPAEILVDGVLCCHAPPHRSGQVPFYVTCSNRIACSEVREFDYLLGSTKGLDITNIYGSDTDEMLLHVRLERLLSLGSVKPSKNIFKDVTEKKDLINKIISLKEEEESNQKVDLTPENDLSQYEVKEHLLKKLIKDKLYSWLFHKVTEDGKGPSVLDDNGQGALHLAAALGYNWAIKPIVTSGVSINFRDVNGWTALHWAALYGREQTVALLVSLGAAPGAVTDPSPEFPLGRTPADLASVTGQKGISGFLAESSLTSYLSSLTVNEPKNDCAAENSGTTAVQTVSERTATPVNYFDMPDTLSLKDSLTAVRNATQAADRIHLMFRMQSFERRQLSDLGDDEFGLSDEHALSLLATKTSKAGPSYGQAHAAAVHIQKKYRGWKKRKEFLIIRQRIVKIQAHVRGHQVRKQYRAIIWSVGILEKIILRWRRKGSGLRGFRNDAVIKDSQPDPQHMPLKDDDYDFFKEGRKQTEERLQSALTRVKSMVQYPEGRAQYRRLLNVVDGFRETKVDDMALNSETADSDENLVDIDTLLHDDTFMSIAFE
ncbi:calmodulin-binding transcription activator 2 isoform X1 [Ziziphus jujuba]|uniref:Calmodulin-binding transcription activator 2 isoform X1 n=1 Tax=Ziziphus jujuba TaxID=326968 RepID=A0A6P3ZWW0_ZIZJJ|nr:calmodulin-binding transcription activator 2 isoform X1 [Ziziphus jujuba]